MEEWEHLFDSGAEGGVAEMGKDGGWLWGSEWQMGTNGEQVFECVGAAGVRYRGCCVGAVAAAECGSGGWCGWES